MSTLQQRNDSFSALLDRLNTAQRRAVEQVEGPVLVVAGPGTGKTHILAARIGKILLETDARPQNILCLTFTDAGVTAMRERLLGMIGPDAHRVVISTFHGFCNRVIQENMELFGKGRLEPVTDLERIEIVRRLLAQLPPEHPLREGKKDIYQYENHLRDLFANMKKEGWTPGHVIKKANEFIDGLPVNPDFIYQRNTKHARKGDPKTAQIEDVTDRLNRLKAAADLYPKYLAAMERAGRYEYEDMILWVLREFERNEALLRTYQERFLYVQVDEFQDTNGAQFRLLQLLLHFWEAPNVFVVGDDDQSIFEFQGARLENLRRFHGQYRPALETVVLEENYRSTQDILDSAGKVIAHNEIRAVRQLEEPIEKKLRAAVSTATGAPELRVYENRLQELTDVVGQIEQLVSSGVAPEQIAVIYARHRQAVKLTALLGKKHIPYQTKRPVNALDLPAVQQFRELLRYLHEEATRPYSGEHRLFRLLHAAFFGLPPGDLARIAVAAQTKQTGDQQEHTAQLYDVPQLTRRTSSRGPWIELRTSITGSAYLQIPGLTNPAAFDALSKYLDQWIAAVHNLPLPQLFERLFSQTGLLTWTLAQADKIQRLQALYTLHDFVQNEVNRHPRTTLARLLDLLDSMDDNKLPLPLQQPVESGPGVQLLTAHGAKGLEFQHVFMFDCVADAWEKNSGGGRGRFALPPTLTLSGEEDALEARRRLFYVAMTRAKQRLVISCAGTGDDGKPMVQSMFAEETGLPRDTMIVPQAALSETQTLLLLEPDPPAVTIPEPAAFEALLRNFTLSVTALNRYLRCPLAFYYEDFLKIPGAMSEAAAFGVAMHGALQQFLLKMKSDKKLRFPPAETLVRMFAGEMERQRGYFSEHNYTQRLALGKDYLRRIHVEQVPYWRKRAIAERRIDRVELDGVPIAGVLDKIEWLDNGTLRIVDYKTGAPAPNKTAPPDDKQPYGGDYWRQLAFYKILLEKANIYPEPVSKTAISWLEPDKRGAFPITEVSFGGEDLQFVENLIRETWANIREARFSPGCGKDDCPWCRMYRWNEAPVEGVVRAEENLDDFA